MRMPFVKAARRSLIGIVIVVILAVLFNYVNIWRSRDRAPKKTPEILSPEMARSADSIEYLERKDGIVRFRIRARRGFETRQGKKLLEGIEACDFNPDGSIHNEIRSEKAEFDQGRKLVSFSGNVRIFLHRQVELRTSSLHYDLNTNIGTTSDALEFRSRQASGTARGIRFDQKRESLDLRNEVDVTLIRNSTKSGNPEAAGKIHATSERAYCSQLTRQIIFAGKARVESGSSVLSGDQIEAIWSADQKRLTSLTSTGNAAYQSHDGDENRALSGDRINFGIGTSGALEKIGANGQAVFSSISPMEEENLRGGEIDLEFDAAKEVLTRIQSRTGVAFQMKRGADQTLISGDQLDAKFSPESRSLTSLHVRGNAGFSTRGTKESAGNELHADEIQMRFREADGRAVSESLRAEGSARWISMPPQNSDRARPEPEKIVTASLLEMAFSAKGDFLESGTASGKVVVSEDPGAQASLRETRRLLADSAQFLFFPRSNRIREINAAGHVQTAYEKRSDSAGNAVIEEFHTASEQMKAVFAFNTAGVESASQWGNFSYRDSSRSATAGRCDYDAGKGILVLKESPKISDPTGSTTADRMEYEQKRKVLSAHGKVRSILKAEKGGGLFSGSSESSKPSLVKADEMQYWEGAGRLRYMGTVQLLSEDQQLQAQVVEIFGGGERVEAQGDVLHRLPGKEGHETNLPSKNNLQSNKSGAPLDSARAPIVIRSSNLKYLQKSDAISYSGKVAVRSGDLSLSSENLDAVWARDDRKVKRANARGKVLIRQGAEECKGEAADWYLDEGKLVVVGKPAEIFTPARGRSYAPRLTYFNSDDRILLETR